MTRGKRKMKKVRFFIFEGYSDIVSLGRHLEATLSGDDCKVIARHTHGDITSNWETTSGNLLEKVKEVVDKYKGKYKLSYEDFHEIVQVVDLDGAYASDWRIVYGDCPHPIIDAENGLIRTRSRRGIMSRNEHKREMLDLLVDCDNIEGVPYRVLFLSSNLEHVLHDAANCTDDEKQRLSDEFAQRYEYDPSGFVGFITGSPFSVKEGYAASWDYIRDERHDSRSLERCTNLGVLFM